jgi:hypothetical protein
VVVVVEIGGRGSEVEVDVDAVGTGRRVWFGCDELVVVDCDEDPLEVGTEPVEVVSEPVELDVEVDCSVEVDVEAGDEVKVDVDVDVGPTG